MVKNRDLKTDRTLRNVIPPLTSEEYEELETDILKRGCEQPIDVWKGHDIIIDGHNRYDICIKNKISYDVREMPFDVKKDVLEYMITKQLSRRNISASDRIELVKKRYTIRGGPDSVSILTREERKLLAKEAGVSEGTVHKHEAVLKDGDKRTKKAMKDKDITISKAYDTMKRNKPKKTEPESEPDADPVAIPEQTNDGKKGPLSIEPENSEKISAPENPPPHPDELPEGMSICSKCKGSGYTKEVVHIMNEDYFQCGACGAKKFINFEDMEKCPNCGAEVE